MPIRSVAPYDRLVGGDQIVTRHAECERKIARYEGGREGGREVDVVKRSDVGDDEDDEPPFAIPILRGVDKNIFIRVRECLAYNSAALYFNWTISTTICALPCPRFASKDYQFLRHCGCGRPERAS